MTNKGFSINYVTCESRGGTLMKGYLEFVGRERVANLSSQFLELQQGGAKGRKNQDDRKSRVKKKL